MRGAVGKTRRDCNTNNPLQLPDIPFLEAQKCMRELIRTNDAVLVSAVVALLESAGIRSMVFDQNMSVLEGSLGVLPRRVLSLTSMSFARGSYWKTPAWATSYVPMTTDSETSEDAILGGRLRVRQPLRGHRVGHDAILLAAATCARATERTVELGAGVGAAAFAIAARAPGTKVMLVEIDPALCALARHNARLNRLEEHVTVFDADAESVDSLKSAGLSPESFNRVLMNPPFHDARRHNVSPDPRRRLAHSGEAGLLKRWVDSAAWLLKANGVLVLIWRADALDEVIETLQPVFGAIAMLPVHPGRTPPRSACWSVPQRRRNFAEELPATRSQR
jgi:tRNA1(Val) A37 N6-methylase TrmN6